jgi:glycosyltransferase involved in cell wall biosynthesis
MSKNQLPVVAVIIPCHNHGKFVLNAIKSVTSQDYPAKLIVVIDDGSTDGSYNTVKEQIQNITEGLPDNAIGGNIEGVPVFLLKNEIAKKQAFARNRGIKYAWGGADIFAILDADDEYLPTKLSKSVAKILDNAELIGMVYSDVLIKHLSDGRIIHEFREPYTRVRLEQECITCNAPVFTKLALEVIGLYDEDLPPCEDWDLAIRVTERFVCVHIPEPLHLYHVTGFNCTETVPKEVWNVQWNKVQQKLHQRHTKSN